MKRLAVTIFNNDIIVLDLDSDLYLGVKNPRRTHLPRGHGRESEHAMGGFS